MTERSYADRRADTYAHELAISAATYDTLLVSELCQHLAPRVGGLPCWTGQLLIAGDEVAHPLAHGASRLALVLHQRVWSHDSLTREDAAVLQERLRVRPRSVAVVSLDAEPVPMWLAGASRCSLTEVGVEGVIDFTLAAIAACGGMARAVEAPRTAPVNGDEHRFDRPTPFLEQHRAFSSLRHELDRLAADLEGGDTEFAPERIPEVLTLPNRLIVRIGTTGLSFSWLSGGTVAEGRLLVIEWSGMQPAARGVTPLKSAVALRERVYRPEAAGPDGWRWRADDPNGCAYSTAHLAAEWLFAASIATSA